MPQAAPLLWSQSSIFLSTFHAHLYCAKGIISVRHSCRSFFPPLPKCHFPVTVMGNIAAGIDQHYSIQCRRTVAPEHQQRKSLNLWIKCLGSTQGKVCGSSGAMLVPALQIYYYNIIMVNKIKLPTIGLFVYCDTTGITPTTASLFCWHKTVFPYSCHTWDIEM